jgi:S1-C subfamily serine protease
MFDILDGILLVAVVIFAVSGYRQGFVVGALSFVGFLGGGVLGAKLARPVTHLVGETHNAPLVALLVVLGLAVGGQVAATAIGASLRGRLTWRPGRAADNIAGAILSGLSVLLVAWLLANAVSRSPFTGLAKQVGSSQVLSAVDTVMPGSVRGAFADLRTIVDRNGFPQVFAGFGGGPVAPVGPPNPATVTTVGVQNAAASVLKVRGIAPSCSKQVEGSGFVFAPEHVMTNAHVVAGVKEPNIIVNGRAMPARAVLFDPETDIAVLYVPGLTTASLHFQASPAGQPDDDAVVAGYPEDGPLTTVAARIRDRLSARAPDIYSRGTVVRDIFSVRAQVLPGNSGGPLLSSTGSVYGVIFAAATDTSQTGYALTAAQVRADAAAAATATTGVSTRGCD